MTNEFIEKHGRIVIVNIFNHFVLQSKEKKKETAMVKEKKRQLKRKKD